MEFNVPCIDSHARWELQGTLTPLRGTLLEDVLFVELSVPRLYLLACQVGVIRYIKCTRDTSLETLLFAEFSVPCIYSHARWEL